MSTKAKLVSVLGLAVVGAVWLKSWRSGQLHGTDQAGIIVTRPRTAEKSPEIPQRGERETLASTTTRLARVRRLDLVESDFATGERYNVVFERGVLRLAPDAQVSPELGGVCGIYVSPIRTIRTPEQQDEESFDRIDFNYEWRVPPGSDVVFEYRTIAVDEEGEGWTPWRELPPDERRHPVVLGAMAEKWQYRIVLFAPEAARGPEIGAVQVTTHQDAALAAEVFRFTRQLAAKAREPQS